METWHRLFRATWNWVFEPFAELMIRLGVTPNQVSVAGVLLSLWTAYLIVQGQFTLAGMILLTAGGLDLLDGLISRLGNMATPFGAFLDSTLDRVSEGLVFTAIAYLFAARGQNFDVAMVMLAFLGSVLVSYTRARAEGLGYECKVGIMPRAERMAALILGLLFGLLTLGIYLIVALTAVTTIQRALHTRRQMLAAQADGQAIE